MRRRLGFRRAAVLWLGATAAVASFVLEGFWLTAAAFAATAAISVLAAALHRIPRPSPRRRNGSRVRIATLPLAGLSWMLAALADLAAPAARAIRSARGLHALRGVPALIFVHAHAADQWASFIDVAFMGALVSLLLAIRSVRRPRWQESPDSQIAFNHARAIVAQHGKDSLAAFILRPDKSFVFGDGGVAAYQIVGGTVVVSGDPVGPDGCTREVLTELLDRAHAAGFRVALYGASERHLETYRALGLRPLRVGEEAVVNPLEFTLEGRRVRKLRQSVHRVHRRGWQILACAGRDIDLSLEAEINELEAAWRSERGRVHGFAMSFGEFDPGVRPDDLYLLGRSPSGQLQAVMRFLAVGGKLSLDMMRRVGETPNGLNEALVCRAIEFARAHEIEEVSLNYAGLGHLVRAGSSRGRLRDAAIRVALGVLRARFQMDRLVLFNEKFLPSWRPRYLIYETPAALPGTVFRVLQAEGYLPSPAAKRGREMQPRLRPSPARLAERLRG